MGGVKSGWFHAVSVWTGTTAGLSQRDGLFAPFRQTRGKAPEERRRREADDGAQEEPFAAIIRCTADPAKVDKRTRSKWSRALRYALAYKLTSEPLDQFIKRKGGINECAAKFATHLRRCRQSL